MILRFTYDCGDGPAVVGIRPVTMIRWERSTKRRMSDLAAGFAMEDMARMIFLETDPGGTFDEFIGTLVTVEVDAADPDRPAGEAS